MKLNIVPARTGIQWVKLGIRTFFRQPLALAGLFFMYMAAVLVLSAVPVAGLVLGGLLVPAATLGLMAASEQAASGKFPMPSVLLSGFRAGRQRARAMLVLGVIYTLLSLGATALGGLVDGPTPAPAAANTPQIDSRGLIVLLLHTPIFLLFWHAPALVHWHGVPPVKSLFFSAVACLRNFGALLMYGLAWGGIFMGVAFIVGTIGLFAGGATLAQGVLMPAALMLTAMFSTSVYFTFRDSFVADDETPATPSTPEALHE